MVTASSFGFAPGNPADVNSAALQRAADCGGEVFVDGRGIADISEAIVLGSDVTLRFENGLYLRRTWCCGETGYAFVNRGAFTGEVNRHIQLVGLRLICNGVQHEVLAVKTEKNVPGLNGHICFFRVQDLVIRDLECLDLPPLNFCLHICTFDNVIVENVRIAGLKDGVHFGNGRRFVVRHGVFQTYDDPIALNAHDYTISNPELGWIEDGLIEDCYDLDHEKTSGFFCRILGGSWVDWFEGMEVQNSDAVVHNGRIYRVFMPADRRVFKSVTPPAHTEGAAELDGICWIMMQEGTMHSCACRNIHFRDIHLQKHRPVGFAFHFDKDAQSRSVYPHSQMAAHENICIEHVYMEAEVPNLLFLKTPVKGLRVVRSELDNTMILVKDVRTPGIAYDETEIVLEGCTFRGEGAQRLVQIQGKRTAWVETFHSRVENPGYVPLADRGVRIGRNDIGLRLVE